MADPRFKNAVTVVVYAEEVRRAGTDGLAVIKRDALKELIELAKRSPRYLRGKAVERQLKRGDIMDNIPQ